MSNLLPICAVSMAACLALHPAAAQTAGTSFPEPDTAQPNPYGAAACQALASLDSQVLEGPHVKAAVVAAGAFLGGTFAHSVGALLEARLEARVVSGEAAQLAGAIHRALVAGIHTVAAQVLERPGMLSLASSDGVRRAATEVVARLGGESLVAQGIVQEVASGTSPAVGAQVRKFLALDVDVAAVEAVFSAALARAPATPASPAVQGRLLQAALLKDLPALFDRRFQGNAVLRAHLRAVAARVLGQELLEARIPAALKRLGNLTRIGGVLAAVVLDFFFAADASAATLSQSYAMHPEQFVDMDRQQACAVLAAPHHAGVALRVVLMEEAVAEGLATTPLDEGALQCVAW